LKVKKPAKRIQIPKGVQTVILLANRHACCVCQKPRVQLHHIDGDPANNDPANIASLCLDHHDMASMQVGLTKKLQPDEVRAYKATWEARCTADITALARARFTFYYSMYKNPQRLLEAYYALNDSERRRAVAAIRERLDAEEQRKREDSLFGMNAVPRADAHTDRALNSVHDGESRPSYLGTYKPHPADPSYSADFSTQEAMLAFHEYDLWCQVVAQTLAEAKGTTPIEDLYKFSAEEIDSFAGRLVTFRFGIRGTGVYPPRMWEQHPTAVLRARATAGGQHFRVSMPLRTMYLFSDTAAVHLANGRASGLGLLTGATRNAHGEIEIAIAPLLIGTGGWNLYPEYFPTARSVSARRSSRPRRKVRRTKSSRRKRQVKSRPKNRRA
jgi:hypothetical protein